MKTFLMILSSLIFLVSCAVLSDREAIEDTKGHIKPIEIKVRKPIIKDRN